MEIGSTRSVLSGSRTRSVLGGSGIVEGGFERSVSPATWERRIGDVGGEMGFAGVRGTSDRRLRVEWSWGEMGFGPCEECVEKCVSSHQIRKCVEGKMEAENILRLGKLILQSNWILFSVRLYFQVVPNTHSGIKCFQILVYMWNKRSNQKQKKKKKILLQDPSK